VAMHGVRRAVLEAQAAAAQLPLWTVPLPWPCPNELYERRLAAACGRAIDEGIQAVAFGDLFLEDVRAYRERQLAPTGLEPLFPLWRVPTGARAFPAWIQSSCRRRSPGASSTKICCAIFRRESIPAASAASFTPASTPAPCLRRRFRSPTEKW
jgi:hypothetical protein